MPWSCQPCQREHNDDVTQCPECGETKQAWTFQVDKTRALRITGGRTKLQARRGLSAVPLAEEAPFESVETGECPVIAKAELLALRERGELPAPADRLIARVWPRNRKRNLLLCAERSGDEPVEHEVPHVEGALSDEGWFEVQFLCVYGPEDVSGVALPGLELVDVSDAEAEGGFASEVELSALKKVVELVSVARAAPSTTLLEVEDICFATGREILFPGGWSRADAITGLGVVAAALTYARRHPECRLLVAGHADKRGSVASNAVLSGDRARNVYLYLSGQKEAWAEHCQQHYEVADLQALLKWVWFMYERECDPGSVDGIWGPGSRKARDAFRARYNEEHGGSLELKVKQNLADWGALYHLYELELAEKLATDVSRLDALRGAVRYLDPPTLACSEHWPTARPDAPAGHAADRRVDVLFFREDALPALPGSPPGQAIYGGDYGIDYLSVDEAFVEPRPPYGDAPFSEVCRYARTHAGV